MAHQAIAPPRASRRRAGIRRRRDVRMDMDVGKNWPVRFEVGSNVSQT
jgi:hypothetical protein